MSDYEKELNTFYIKVIETIEYGIQENKYFYNIYIFNEGQEFLTDYMEKEIFDIVSKMFPDAKSLSSLLYYNNNSAYSNVSFIHLVKEIGRYATMSYYKDKFKSEGKIDLDMDIRNFNLSLKALNLLKDNIITNDDIITLGDVLKISTIEVLNWDNSNRYNKKQVIDLTNFCTDLIYNNSFDNSSFYKNMHQQQRLIKCRELIEKLSSLQDQYNSVSSKRKELELSEKEILETMQKLRSELAEISFAQEENESCKSI